MKVLARTLSFLLVLAALVAVPWGPPAHAADPQIQGTLTGGGAAVANADVTLYAYDPVFDEWSWWNSTTTDAIGHWSFSTLDDGDYRVGFDATGLVSEYWNDKPSVQTADSIPVTATSSATANADLATPASVRGKVTTATGTAIPDASLTLYRYDADFDYWDSVDYAYTAADGQYTFPNVTPGTYRLGAQASGYVTKFHANAATVETGTDIVVRAGEASTVDLSLSTGARITGTVRNAAGTALAGADVTTYRWNASWQEWVADDSATTDGTGAYTLAGLAAGVVRVGASATGYQQVFHNGAATVDAGTDVTLVADTTTSLGFTLAPLKHLNGRVTTTGGAAIAGADVTVYRLSGSGYSWFDSTVTSATGDWTAEVPSGTFKVEFDAANYLVQWWNNQPSQAAATPIVVSTGDVGGVNASMVLGGVVSGTVRGPSGTALPSAQVTLYRRDASSPSGWDYERSTSTSSTGTYAFGGLPTGSYAVGFEATGMADEYYLDVYDLVDATALAVTAGSTRTADATLGSGQPIAGTVTGAGGSALPGANVTVYRKTRDADGTTRWESSAFASTSASGTYTTNVAPGTYIVRFSADGYAAQYGGGSTARSLATRYVVTPTAGATASAQLSPLGSISGVVSGPSGTVNGATVRLFQFDTSDDWDHRFYVLSSRTTDATGAYRFTGLAPGYYRLGFSGTNLVPEYYNDATDVTNATDVAVTTAAVTANASLAASPRVIGGLVSRGGLPEQGADVDVYRRVPVTDGFRWQYQTSTSTGSDGRWSLQVAPGTYRFGVGDDRATRWYNGASSLDAATDVVVSTVDLTSLDTALPPRARLQGTVTGPAGPLAGAEVSILTFDPDGYWDYYDSTETDATGAYHLDVPAGTYRVRFEASGMIGEYHPDAATAGAGQDVVVTSGQTRTIDAALARAAVLSGTLTQGGAPAPNGDVTVWQRQGDGSWDWYDSVGTSSLGAWTATVPPGSYALEFRSDGFVPEFWNNAATLATATPLTVTTVDRSGLNADLSPGATISGTVTGPRGAVPWPDVTLLRPDGAGGWFETSSYPETESDGRYVFRGLAAGTYRLKFAGPGLTPEYWNDSPTLASATTINLAAGGSATADAVLVASRQLGGVLTYGGKPLEFADVTAYVLQGSSYVWADYASTDADGRWRMPLPSGTYKLQFDTDEVGATSEWWNNASSQATATAVTLSGADVLNLDADLAPTATIAGSVGFAPEWSGWSTPVSLVDQSTGLVVDTEMASTTRRAYAFTDVQPGSYRVDFGRVTRYQVSEAQFWSAKSENLGAGSATPITVGASQLVSNVNATLALGGSLTGRVTDDTGGGLQDCIVRAFTSDNSLAGRWSHESAPDGSFSVPGLTTGQYKLSVSGGECGTTRYYDGAGVMTSTASGAVPVSATRGVSTAVPQTLSVGAEPAITNTAAPSITGTPQVGSTLTASQGSWSNSPTGFAYQWLRDGAAITGATGTTYPLVAADQGRMISVRVTASRSGYTSATATSAAVGPVAATPAITNTAAPSITGTPQVGSTLTASQGSWSNSPTGFAYQWLRDGAAITGATGTTYSLVAADQGRMISVRVTAIRSGYTSGTATSAAVGPVAAAPVTQITMVTAPTITGTPKVGVPLSATAGTWNPADVTPAYQWLAAGVPITGATTAGYTPTAANVGKAITVTVTATKAGWTSASATSTPTALVAKGTIVAPVPKISGTPRVGSTLKAALGTVKPASVTKKFQWLRNGRAIRGATKAAYKPVAVDRGKKIQVRVTYSKAGYTTVVKKSAAVTIR